MTNTGRPIDLGGGISGIPGFAVFKSRLLKILGILLVLTNRRSPCLYLGTVSVVGM